MSHDQAGESGNAHRSGNAGTRPETHTGDSTLRLGRAVPFARARDVWRLPGVAEEVMKCAECAVCSKRHRQRFRMQPMDVACSLCLDCHGKLVCVGPYVYRCESCGVKHGVSWGVYVRATVLVNSSSGVVTDYSESCVLSPNLPGVARSVHPERK